MERVRAGVGLGLGRRLAVRLGDEEEVREPLRDGSEPLRLGVGEGLGGGCWAGQGVGGVGGGGGGKGVRRVANIAELLDLAFDNPPDLLLGGPLRRRPLGRRLVLTRFDGSRRGFCIGTGSDRMESE